MKDLSKKKCIPCEGGVLPLQPEEVRKYLSTVAGWAVEDGKLVKHFKFKNFKEAIDFINQVAKIAEQEGHHPNIYLYGWNKVKLIFYTHAIGGLHENDFIMAAKVDKLETSS